MVDLAGDIGSAWILKNQPILIPECLVQLRLQMAAWFCMEMAEFCVLTLHFQLVSVVRMKIYTKLLLASPQF